jgi:hypothetical protein
MGGTKYGYDKEGKPFLTKEPNLSGRVPAQKLENFSLETPNKVITVCTWKS